MMTRSKRGIEGRGVKTASGRGSRGKMGVRGG